MNKIYLSPEIYYFENVLSQEDLITVQNFAKNNNQWFSPKDLHTNPSSEFYSETNSEENYNKNNFINMKMKVINEEISKIFLNMFNNFILPAEPDLNITPSDVIFSIPAGYIHKVGSEIDKGAELNWAMKPHADSNPDFEPSVNIKKGLIYYLNDDFEGGEIVYINKSITHKPIANSLIIHPSNEEYTHGVRLVNKGVRYTMTNFYRK
jgi:hypothetical protein